MSTKKTQQSIDERQRLVDVALGKAPADLVITNGTLLNVFTGELLPQTGIAVAGKRIALVGDIKHCLGKNTAIIDADGKHLVPGFIDSHYHMESSLLSPCRHAELTIAHGTTSIFEDTHEIANVLGIKGIKYFLKEAGRLPQKIYLSISSATPPTNFETTGAYIDYNSARGLADEPMVAGIGEIVDFRRLYNHDTRLWGMIQLGLENELLIEGHSSTAPPELDAYISAGVGSTHSPRNPNEAWEMLRRGAQIQLQMDRSEEIVKYLLLKKTPWHLVGLAIDDRPVHIFLEKGGLDYEILKAIEEGVDVITAYQMATINNALHWKMTRDIGSISPGRLADIVL
ncbi:MAG: amidohydrolase family protein, partial [Spirochaetota bacterium]